MAEIYSRVSLRRYKRQVLNWILIVRQKKVELSYHKVDYKPVKCLSPFPYVVVP